MLISDRLGEMNGRLGRIEGILEEHVRQHQEVKE